MRRATTINLAVLGGGLSLIAAAGVLNEHNRYVACRAQNMPLEPGETDSCRSTYQGGSAYHGGGYAGGAGGTSGRSGGVGGIARGGFGGFGGAHGGGE